MENAKNSFNVADYCVFGAVLLISLGIGLYHALSGGKQKTKGEYLMGNHQMSLLPVSISILVSIVSSNTILGVSAEMYHYGIDHFFSIIGSIAACVVTALTFVPLLYPLKLTSCYEYLELRFRSPLPRKLALFTMEVLGYPGLPGLMLACIFSGSLSTVSSSFNSMAACVWEDFLITKLGHIRESNITFIMKMIVVAFGVTCLGMAFLAKNIGGTMMQLAGSFVGVALGPMVGMFFLGGVFTFTEAWGAVTGGIAGLAVPLWMLFGYLMLGLCNPGIPGRTDMCHLPANKSVTNSSSYLILEEATTSTILNSSDCPTGLSEMVKEPLAAIHQFYSISFAWYPAVGFLVTIAVGIVVSILVNLVFGRHPPVDKQLLFPVLRLCLKDAETQINENMDGPVNDQNISLLNLKMKDLKQVKNEFQNGSI